MPDTSNRGSAMGRALVAVLVCVAAALTAAAVPGSASAGPAGACYEVGSPRWAAMRSMADQFVKDGTLTREKAEAYKCNPRLAVQASTASVGFELIKPSGYMTLGCGNTAGIVYYLPSVGPAAIYSRQQLTWCWDGRTVSNWSGVCDGWTSGWGSAIGWSYDGCVTNDFIPYQLNGAFPGGVHHYTKMKYTNITPWTFAQYLASSTWGHFDGSWDYQIH